MQRNLTPLTEQVYDVLIVGAGIYGVFAAWDAALRGLSVALVDKGDFGSATSSNSLRIVHGGLRYLQHADIRRMRQSIHERAVLLRVAPHLIHPLPCLLPTYKHTKQNKWLMALALAMNDLIGFDRNWHQEPQKHLPNGKIISPQACRQLCPGIETDGLTGGAVWYDCQLYNSERLLLAVLRSASAAGAVVANYVKAVHVLLNGHRVVGIRAQDVLQGEELEIRAKMVVNASGPWVDQVLGLLGARRRERQVVLSKAMNLFVKRQLIPNYAVGVSSRVACNDHEALVRKDSRLLFITPWRDGSLIGTTHTTFDGDADAVTVSEQEVCDFLQEVNDAYPPAALELEDVFWVYKGLLPMHAAPGGNGHVSLVKQFRIHDHASEDGIENLLSVVGVKYTTARDVAQRTVDLVCKKLGKKVVPCLTAKTPVHGGRIDRFDTFLTQETCKRPYGLAPEVVRHLVCNYGSAYTDILNTSHQDREEHQLLTPSLPVIKAEVRHGIREEMAQKLSDVIFRRTELGRAGNPGDDCLKTCAAIMAAEMGWDAVRIGQELEEVRGVFQSGVPLGMTARVASDADGLSERDLV